MHRAKNLFHNRINLIFIHFRRHFPYSEKFVDLWVPAVLTLVFTAIIFTSLRYFCEKNKLPEFIELIVTIILGLLFSIVIFYLQERFYHFTFTDALKEFIIFTKNSHPVTQKFFSVILSNCINGDYKTMELFINNKRSLEGLVHSLESQNGGIVMNSSLYSQILSNSVEFNPTEIHATWDTQKIKLSDNPMLYSAYFNDLGKIYPQINKNNKNRVFIFKDIVEYDNRLNFALWSAIINYHLAWGFEKLYYCYENEYDDIKSTLSNGLINLDDFVFFSKNKKSSWIISRNKNSEKVHLFRSNIFTESTRKFYEELISNSKEIKLYNDYNLLNP